MIYKYSRGDQFVSISRQTSSIWVDLIRGAICFHVESNSSLLGGDDNNGNKKVAEIDESLFFRRKYNRGRLLHEQWYLGGIERGSRKVFIVPVPNRNATTIARVISENVLPDKLIATDQWRAYNRAISIMEDMDHVTINHLFIL